MSVAEERPVRLLFSSGKMSVSKWFLPEPWMGLSVLNIFRKWAYERVFVHRVVGLRLNGSSILVENHNQLKETTLEVVSRLRELVLTQDEPRKTVTLSFEGPTKVKVKALLPSVDKDQGDLVLANVLPGERVEFEVLTSNYLDPNETQGMTHEGRDFISVSKDLTGVSRCYFEETLYEQGFYRVVIETVSTRDHAVLIRDFLSFFSSLSGSLALSETVEQGSRAEDWGLSDRSLAMLKMWGINDRDKLLSRSDSVDWGSLSLDSSKVLRLTLDRFKGDEAE